MWCAPALALVLVLGGCAQAETDLSAAASGRLQTLVVSVAQTAATGDFASALVQLDALQAELVSAREQGDVSEERASSIQASIDAVRADLQLAAEPAVPSAPVEQTVEQTVDAPVSEAPEVPAPQKTKEGREDGRDDAREDGREDGPGRGNGGGGGAGGNGGNGGKGGGPGR